MKFNIKGLNEYVKKLENISNQYVAQAYIEEAIKKGADVVADETRKALESLPVDNRNYVVGKRDSIMQVQKDGLLNDFGISPVQDKNGFINVKTGIGKHKNKLGQRNTTIARRLESGTSYMPKNPVISRASRKARSKCIEEMQKSLTKAYRDLMKG